MSCLLRFVLLAGILCPAVSAPVFAGREDGKLALPQLVDQARGAEADVPAIQAAGPAQTGGQLQPAGQLQSGAPLQTDVQGRVAAAKAQAAAARPGAVMLQGFHWRSHATKPWWGVVSGKAAEIGSSGFDLIWLPPPSNAVSDEGYLPSRWYLLDSMYGNQAQLQAAIGALRSAGVKAVADVVLNHRVGTKDWADFDAPAWGPEAVCRDDEWGKGLGAADTGKGYHAGRDIDHTNPNVQRDVIEWLRWLKWTIGFDGWRFDYVRGYAPKYVTMYDEATSPAFAVGEIWDDFNVNDPDSHRQALCDWLDAAGGVVTAFDFTTKALLQHVVSTNEYWRLRDKDGKPAGLIGWWPAKAVTFLDNHDTGPSPGGGQNHWPFPGGKIMQGYAYILTHPGYPMVYWPHFFDWGSKKEIQALIAVRKAAGLTAASKVAIQAADSGRYAAIVDGRVAVKIGPGDWSPAGEWKLAAHGLDYAVWTR